MNYRPEFGPVVRSYTVLFLLSLYSLSSLFAQEPIAPFTAPIPDRPILCEGTVPFPAGEQFCQKTAQAIRDKYGFDQILFIERATFQSSHYYTDFIDGSRFFGTDICVLDLSSGQKRSILPAAMKKGIVNRLDLSFDAKKILFDWKPDNRSGFHIWEMNLDGTGLRQITFPPKTEQSIVDRYALYRDAPRHWVRTPEKYPIDFGVYQRWTDDIHPAYLSDGGIVFASTRCQHGILCDGDDILSATVLYRTRADGKTDDEGHLILEPLTNSAVSEANPVLTEDGRILYTRWEYIDKGASCVKCVWSMRQDGTASAEVFGNDHASPPSIVHARQVPGQPQLFVATGAPHCPQTGVGGLIGIDTRRDIRTSDAYWPITPETRCIEEGNFNHSYLPDLFDANETGAFESGAITHPGLRAPCFSDPFPLDADALFCSAALDVRAFFNRPDGYGLYFLPNFNETRSLLDGKFLNPGQNPSGKAFLDRYQLIYRAAGTSCYQPTPVRVRPVPPINKSEWDETLAQERFHGFPLAGCLITDVYEGLENVSRGEAKYIRINEQVPRPWSARRTWGGDFRNNPSVDVYDQQHSPVGATHLGLKVQWGIVPIEPDGSAWFYVPADRNIFFQVLDSEFRELQRERTYVNYRPGEIRSCVGCHETPRNTPGQKTDKLPQALKRPASLPGPQPGESDGARTLSFVVDVQPILDAQCVRCHDGDYTDPESGKRSNLDLRSVETPLFNVAYENLLGFRCSGDQSYSVVERPANQSLVGKVIREIRPKVGNAEYLPAKTLGSTTAPLIQILDRGHYNVQLTLEQRIRLTTWVDSNCQYYGSYVGAKNKRFKSLPNYRIEVPFDEALVP